MWYANAPLLSVDGRGAFIFLPLDRRDTMNTIQKQKIAELKSQGESYSQIAALLGISENTIKSHCRRNNLCSAKNVICSTTADDSCQQCGRNLKHIERHKKKKFCSDKCRMDWWNSHLHEVKRKALYQFTCPVCGKDFQSYGNNKRIYCSRSCFGKTRRA